MDLTSGYAGGSFGRLPAGARQPRVRCAARHSWGVVSRRRHRVGGATGVHPAVQWHRDGRRGRAARRRSRPRARRPHGGRGRRSLPPPRDACRLRDHPGDPCDPAVQAAEPWPDAGHCCAHGGLRCCGKAGCPPGPRRTGAQRGAAHRQRHVRYRDQRFGGRGATRRGRAVHGVGCWRHTPRGRGHLHRGSSDAHPASHRRALAYGTRGSTRRRRPLGGGPLHLVHPSGPRGCPRVLCARRVHRSGRRRPRGPCAREPLCH